MKSQRKPTAATAKHTKLQHCRMLASAETLGLGDKVPPKEMVVDRLKYQICLWCTCLLKFLLPRLWLQEWLQHATYRCHQQRDGHAQSKAIVVVDH